MKSWMIIFSICGFILFSSFTFGSKSNLGNPEWSPEGARMQPCRIWTRDFNTRGYICDFLDTTVNVATSSELNEVISYYNAKIATLEKRIEDLEGSNP